MARNGIEDAVSMIPNFKIEGHVICINICSNGHINDTFDVITSENRYILQRINKYVFPHPDQVMENIDGVTSFLQKGIAERNGDPRESMTIIKTNEDKLYYLDEYGDFWRCYYFVEDSVCYNRATSKKLFKECGFAFGNFQAGLGSYPVEKLHDTIPHFHDTKKRVETFKKSFAEDKVGRAASVKDLYEAYLKESYLADFFHDLVENKEVPLRVTHNDTKINNVLFDKYSGSGLCVIDLDTVMPGLSAFDFGDSIRFGASTANEEELDNSIVHIDLKLFKAYAEGFIKGCNGALTEKEIDVLTEGAMDMTFECGMRFLTDYLDGDVYFKIHDPEQNLRRSKTQFALLMDMEKHKEEMHQIIESLK